MQTEQARRMRMVQRIQANKSKGAYRVKTTPANLMAPFQYQQQQHTHHPHWPWNHTLSTQQHSYHHRLYQQQQQHAPLHQVPEKSGLWSYCVITTSIHGFCHCALSMIQ